MTNDSPAPLEAFGSDNPEWWTEERIVRYFGAGTIAALHARALVAQVADQAAEITALKAQLAEANASLQAIADFQGTMFGEDDDA